MVGAILLGASAASAHPTLLFTDPDTDGAVARAPRVITLVFTEAVTIGSRALILTDAEGHDMSLGPASTARHGHAVTATVLTRLGPGTYVVRWRVTGSDGDLLEQQFRFAVGAPPTSAGATGSGMSISWVAAALRWVLFAGLATALGGVFGQRLSARARAENPRLPAVGSQVAPGALIGLVAVVGLAALLVTESSLEALWRGQAGRQLVVEAAGLALASGLTLWPPRRRGGWWAGWWPLPPSLVVVIAEGSRAHPNTIAPGWGALLTAVHVAAVAIWVGALAQVARALLAWRGYPGAVRWVLSSYARLAAWVFVLVVITGTLSAVLLVPLAALITTTYGRVLVVKLVLVALAAALGYAGHRAWRADRLDQARARVGVEVSVLVAVLAASAVLVSTPPVTASPPVPPPPRGAVVPLGMLAGQISVAVAASDGQLVVRLATGRRGDYYAPAPHQGYTLAGQLLPPQKGRGPGAPLAFRGCGEGCFVAPAAWARGDNVLTLRAQAADWRGGTVSLLLPWPARPGGTELAHAAQLMRATAQVTVYEAVTSDTTGAPPVTNRLRLAGEFFLSQEPYASGVAPIAARISPDGQPVRLALGYPAAAINATLTLDAAGRISEETLTDTTHLIHRRFAYPDHN